MPVASILRKIFPGLRRQPNRLSSSDFVDEYDVAPDNREMSLISSLESAGDGCGLVLVKEDGDIVWFNELSGKWFCLSRRDTGRNITYLIRHPVFLEHFKQGDFGEIAMFRKTNPDATVGMSVLPWGTDCRLIMFYDFSHQQRLEDSSREIMANLSHELRSPLTVIKGYLDTLAMVYGGDKEHDASVSQAIRNMLKQCERMQQTVEDMLLLGRLETSVADSDKFEVVNIDQLIYDLVSDLKETFPNRRIETAGNRYRVRCLRTEIYSVFSNLLINAMNYSSDDSVVCLKWYTQDDSFYFNVIDQGIGIEDVHIPHLAERFYRVDKARSNASGGGVGLGLAIVSRILNRYGANLKISSQYGVGSTFTCVFPQSFLASS